MKIKGGAKEDKKVENEMSSDNEKNEERLSMGQENGVKKPKKNPVTAFTTYIYRVKKQVHPDLNISKNSMRIIESFVSDFFNRLCRESSQLMASNGNKTLRAEDVLTAIKMVLPGELGKHAYNEAEKAINTYVESVAESN